MTSPETENRKPETWHFQDGGQGPPLLLLHGLGASGFSWRDNLEPLARHFRVLAPDIPPHGRSPAPLDGDYRIEALVQGVKEFLDRRGLSRTAVAGNSLGGGLALLLARDYPEMVSALVLLAPAAALNRIPWIFYPLRFPGLGLITASLLGPWMLPWAMRFMYYRRDRITKAAVAGYAGPYREMRRRLALRRLCQSLEIWPLARVEAMLRDIHQPALLIWGEKDRVLPVSQAPWIQARLPGAGLIILPEVGHAPQEEVPDAVNKLIIDFLGRSLIN